jgi:hypothetical protein
MKPIGTGARLAMGGPMLAGLALQIASSSAQAPSSERELVDRVRQIQGQLEPGAAPPAGAREQELIERIQALRREAQSEAAAAARPELGEDEVQALLREGLGVEILKIEPIEAEGRAAYAVTVMNPPGNDNSAFAVETLVVDGATGGLLGRVPQLPRTGTPDLAESSGPADGEGSGLEIRRRTHR